ncbi:MAG: S9 family peptidase, partial [Terracidiphilus sp.]
MRIFLRFLATSLCLVAVTNLFSQSIRSRGGFTLPPPPEVQTNPVTDDYFGTRIMDNYRWLEDEKSDATQAFIDAENAYTDQYFHQDRIYSEIPDQLGALMDVTETGFPTERNGNFFFMRRLGGEQQYSIYYRHGWTGKDVRLLDPAVISRDPNTSITLGDVSRDGSQFIYSVKQGGADETAVHVFDVKTKKTLVDELPSARYFSLSFAPDGKSFYYARYGKTGTLLYQHVLGDRPLHDQLIFGREFRGESLGGQDLFSAHITDDGRYLVIQIDRGVPARRVDIVFRD